MRGARVAAGAFALACLAAVTLDADASRAYVSNEDGHTVTVIDTDLGKAVATIPVGKRPRGIKVHPDGKRVYVALSGLPKCPPSVPDEECAKLGRDLDADGVAIIDTTSLKVVGLLKAGSDPEQFDFSPDGRLLFVTNEDASLATVLDTQTRAIRKQIAVGREPEGVRASPDGRWVLVTNESDNTVSVIDARTFKVVRSVPVGKRPRDAAFARDSRSAYVPGEFDASLYRIAVPEGAPVERLLEFRKEARPMAAVLDSAERRLYVSMGRGGTVAVVDLSGPRLITEIPVGPRPWGIALSADGARLYTANGPSNDVSVIDTESLTVVKKIPVGRSPWGVAVAPSRPTDTGKL